MLRPSGSVWSVLFVRKQVQGGSSSDQLDLDPVCGPTGPTGPTGATGPTGPTGPTACL